MLREHFRRKYDGKRLDLIVAVMAPSLDFLLRHGSAVFPGVPIVFCGVDASDIEGKVLPGNVTGVVVKRAFAPTLDIALRLQPDTAHVYVVSGTSRFDQQIQAIARRDLAPLERRLGVTWLTALPMDELLRTLADLPPHSVVYFLGFFADGADRTFIPHEALARIARVANAPVYVSVDQFVGLGAVGGHVYSVSTHGRQAAEMGVRILRGTAAALPAAALDAHRDVFDWRQLRRWSLEEQRLPKDSVVQFRVPSVWESYKWAIAGGVTLFALQSALVVGLLVNRAQRRRAESARQESEQRRRRAEEELQSQRDELAHTLRVATLGELTTSLAHEITQPLAAIANNAQAARMLLAAELPPNPDLAEALDDMAQDAQRAGETVRRLRALFRKQPTERMPVNVNVLVAEVLELLANDMQRRRIEVHVVPAEGLPLVLGDDVQLRQVVINVLLNAADAIVAAGDGPREIRILTGLSGTQEVEIAIRDSGVGVEEDRLERIFEHFVSSKPGGLGMGLAISRSIIAAHHGRMWATRNEGRGLTLHIQLPLTADATGSGRAGPEPAPADRQAGGR